MFMMELILNNLSTIIIVGVFVPFLILAIGIVIVIANIIKRHIDSNWHVYLDALAAETIINLPEAGSYVLELNRRRALFRGHPLHSFEVNFQIIQASTGIPVDFIHGKGMDGRTMDQIIGVRAMTRTGFTRVTIPSGYFDAPDSGEYIVKNTSDNYFKRSDKLIIRESFSFFSKKS